MRDQERWGRQQYEMWRDGAIIVSVMWLFGTLVVLALRAGW